MSIKKSLSLALLAIATSMAYAQVSDSTAIAGVAGAAPTLDCGAGQVKVGSSCAIIFQNGVTEGAACTSIGDITLGATAGKLLLSCQSGTWKKAGGDGAQKTGLRGVWQPMIGKSIVCSNAHGLWAHAYVDANGDIYTRARSAGGDTGYAQKASNAAAHSWDGTVSIIATVSGGIEGALVEDSGLSRSTCSASWPQS